MTTAQPQATGRVPVTSDELQLVTSEQCGAPCATHLPQSLYSGVYTVLHAAPRGRAPVSSIDLTL